MLPSDLLPAKCSVTKSVSKILSSLSLCYCSLLGFFPLSYFMSSVQQAVYPVTVHIDFASLTNPDQASPRAARIWRPTGCAVSGSRHLGSFLGVPLLAFYRIYSSLMTQFYFVLYQLSAHPLHANLSRFLTVRYNHSHRADLQNLKN